MKRYRAREGARIPMPDRGGQMVPTENPGTAVNELNPFYARMIADGDLVPADDNEAAPTGADSKRK